MNAISGFKLLPESASTIARSVDALTLGLLVISGIIMTGVFVMIVYFSVKYHKGRIVDRVIRHEAQLKIELTWTFLPFCIAMGLFTWGAWVFYDLHEVPAGAEEISVIGKQWMWKFQHADGNRELNELHVPLGRPIKLIMTSQDVIHSLFVPAFRIKQDVLPGRYTYTWFEASKAGTYHLFCTQFCGTSHSKMGGEVVVMTPAQYQQWSATGLNGGEVMASRGAAIFRQRGCISCHEKNSLVPAPDLARIYGTRVALNNGQTVLADDNYLRESILNPAAKIVMGYQNVMPSYVGHLSEEDVLDLISYIKSLGTTETQKAGS